MAQMTLGELVKQIAARMQKQSVPMPFRNERPWHELFYELKKENTADKPSFFDRLSFDWDGPYPKCRELSEFLHALHWNASVSANNPHYDTINLSKDVADLWEQRSRELEPSSKRFLDIAVDRAAKEFSGHTPTRERVDAGEAPVR
jgi:hypothetical protein